MNNNKKMDEYNALAKRFITLANQMKDEGKPMQMVNASLMSASGIYATYTAAGDEGGVTESGVEKIVAVYKQNLESVQKIKKMQAEQ
jgi:hypothetical protein